MITKLAGYPFWLRLVVVVTLGLFVINLFFFLAPAIAFFSSKDWPNAFGTLVASFIGAWFAFTFARYQRDQERIKKEVAAGNLALFILTQMYSETRQYQKEIVSPYRNKKDSWLNLHIGVHLNKNLSFNLDDISFVLEANPGVFADVILEERRYLGLASLIDEHNELIVSQVWPRLEAEGLKIGDSKLNAEIENIIGPSAVSMLKTTTSGIIQFTDENEKSLGAAFRSLRAVLKSIYPLHKFIDFKPT